MPIHINDKLISWASDIDPETIRQAEKTARLPIVEGHVALMPDAHVGIGATVGSVIPTSGAVIPSAVGVDIGCGMIAAELDVTESQLPDDLEPLLARIEKAIPAGVGKGHDRVARNADHWLAAHQPANRPTESKLVRPLVTDDSSWERFRSFMMNETCSGVAAGVSPKTDAPGSAPARMPVGTF